MSSTRTKTPPSCVVQVDHEHAVPALDPTEKFINVASQRADATHPAVTVGNMLHTLSIAADGTVSQLGAPLNLPVPPSSRPMGLVVF